MAERFPLCVPTGAGHEHPVNFFSTAAVITWISAALIGELLDLAFPDLQSASRKKRETLLFWGEDTVPSHFPLLSTVHLQLNDLAVYGKALGVLETVYQMREQTHTHGPTQPVSFLPQRRPLVWCLPPLAEILQEDSAQQSGQLKISPPGIGSGTDHGIDIVDTARQARIGTSKTIDPKVDLQSTFNFEASLDFTILTVAIQMT